MSAQDRPTARGNAVSLKEARQLFHSLTKDDRKEIMSRMRKTVDRRVRK